MRGSHRRRDYPVAHCVRDHQNWPCDTIKALGLLASEQEQSAMLERNWRSDRDKLVAVRALADSLGDRSAEPRDRTMPSDRRLMEPLRRLLLRILEGSDAE